jgi:hypothetical protein
MANNAPVLLWHVQCAATLTEALRLFQSRMPLLLKFPEGDKQRQLAARALGRNSISRIWNGDCLAHSRTRPAAAQT